MIPKIIHYCWFGKKRKPKLVLDCISTWKKHNPEYEIIEWNESNFPIDNKSLLSLYHQKKWAFIADYARLKILYEYGGIYLDTDMYFLKSIPKLPFERFDCILCAEDLDFISCGFIFSTKNHAFIKNCLAEYELEYHTNLETIPVKMTRVFKSFYNYAGLFDEVIIKDKTLVLTAEYFYPFPVRDKGNIKQFISYKTDKSIAIHLWCYSWKTPVNEYEHYAVGNFSQAAKIVCSNIFKFDKNKILQYCGILKAKVFRKN